MFQLKVEITSVTTNGSWVTITVNSSAGSSGNRRDQRSDRAGARLRTGGAAVAGGIAGVVNGVSCRSGCRGARLDTPAPERTSAVLGGNLVGELLPVGQRLVDGRLPGDRRGDRLRHLRPQVGELRNAD